VKDGGWKRFAKRRVKKEMEGEWTERGGKRGVWQRFGVIGGCEGRMWEKVGGGVGW
jgi:hypothetical protein